MKNTLGTSVCVTLFGESHGAKIGAVLDGLAPGIPVDESLIARQLELRRPAGSISTARREQDAFEIVSGVFEGKTTGTPLAILIPNADTRSGDYRRGALRPGHADYTAHVKYHGFEDYRGGGHFSGRLTAALTAVCAPLTEALGKRGIRVGTHISSLAGIYDRPFGDTDADFETLSSLPFPVLDPDAAEAMKARIREAAEAGDSVGGVLETVVTGVPAGLGEPFFDSVESELAHAMFSIPAVKGVEFGAGFGAAAMRGSENNDAFRIENGLPKPAGNHAGGILGGITTGMPLVFCAAFKPTPSIGRIQRSVNLETGEETELTVTGRHDPCIVPRAVPVVEAAAAFVLTDALLGRRKESEID